MGFIKVTFSKVLFICIFVFSALERYTNHSVAAEDDWFFIGENEKRNSEISTTTTTTTISSTEDYKFDVLSPQNIFYEMPYNQLAIAAMENPNAYETLLHRHYQCVPGNSFVYPLVSNLSRKMEKKDILTLTLEEKYLLIRLYSPISKKKSFIDLLQKQAEEEQNPDAQFLLGYAYHYALCGLIKDETEAVKYYRPSTDQGHPGAQYELGLIYRDGVGGVQQDDAETVKLFTLSANQGYAQAQNHIGYFYDTGTKGFAQDKKEAVRYYKLSASQGYSVGQSNLGVMYENGTGGLVKDENEAIKLYSLAALEQNNTALTNLKKLNQEQAFLVTVKLALDGHRTSKEELQLKIIPSPQEEYPFPEDDFQAVHDVFTSFEGETLYWSSILGSGMDDLCGSNPLFEQLTKNICDEIGLYKKILDHCKVPGTLITCLTTDDIVLSSVSPSTSKSSLPPLFYTIRGVPYISVTDAPVDRLIPEDKHSKISSQISQSFFQLNQLLLQTYQLLSENKIKGHPREMLEILLSALKISGSDLHYFVNSYLVKFPKGSIIEGVIHLNKILEHLENILNKNKMIAETLENMIKKLINIVESTTEYRNLLFIQKIVITK